MRLENSDRILYEKSEKNEKEGAKARTSKKHHVPILEAQKKTPCAKLEAQKSALSNTSKYGSTPTLGSGLGSM